MGIFNSIYRYVVTLGGLIESDIDGRADNLATTPSGIKATFQKTRAEWTKQYAEIRESVAQLMIVLEQKRQKIDALNKESEELKIKMKGAVNQFKSNKDEKYQQVFGEMFNRDKAIATELEQLDGELKELHSKVDAYKNKLKDMQKRIGELDQRESEAIADIVSSKQIINLNDRLNNLSTDLDDKNLRAIEQRRQSLMSQAKLSSELTDGLQTEQNLDEELKAAGMQSEAADVFAAMLAEDKEKGAPETEQAPQERQRDI